MIKYLFTTYASGSVGLKNIGKELAEMGYVNSKGKPYCQTTLAKMLSNTRYKGYYTAKLSEVEDALIDLLNTHINTATNLTDIIDNKISLSNLEYNNQTNKIKLVEIEKDIENFEMLMKEVINDFKNDYISKDDFDYYNTKYLYELNNLKLEKEKIETNINNKLDLSWLYKLKDAKKIQKINKTIIDEFIEDIFVYENRNIEVIFKYGSQYDDLIKYLKMKKIWYNIFWNCLVNRIKGVIL